MQKKFKRKTKRKNRRNTNSNNWLIELTFIPFLWRKSTSLLPPLAGGAAEEVNSWAARETTRPNPPYEQTRETVDRAPWEWWHRCLSYGLWGKTAPPGTTPLLPCGEESSPQCKTPPGRYRYHTAGPSAERRWGETGPLDRKSNRRKGRWTAPPPQQQ